MFWPIVGCVLISAGLWGGRVYIPNDIHSYYDAASLIIITLVFAWLARRAMKYGARHGVSRYRQARQSGARHSPTNDRVGGGERVGEQ